jgi:hypothetical protein
LLSHRQGGYVSCSLPSAIIDVFVPRIIRATRVSKWRLDVGTCSPPMLVMIETLGASGYVVPPPVADA